MRRSNVLVADGIVAVVLAAVVLIFSPGLAIALFIALFVLVVCAVSLFRDLRRGRTRRARPRR